MRGHIIFAPHLTDIIAAERLAQTVSGKISIATFEPDNVTFGFDHILEIPWGETGHDEWKVFHITPYNETLVLSSRLTGVSDNLWDIVEQYDFAVATPDASDLFLDTNQIKSFCGDLFYFKKCQRPLHIMKMADEIFQHWYDIRLTFKAPTPVIPTSDIVWSIIILWLEIDIPDIPIVVCNDSLVNDKINNNTILKLHSIKEKI